MWRCHLRAQPGDPARATANAIWLTEALCELMRQLGPESSKLSVHGLLGAGAEAGRLGRRGLLRVLLFKKMLCHELRTNFADHLQSDERQKLSLALFDHASFQKAMGQNIMSQLSRPAQVFFEFGRRAVFSDAMDASLHRALQIGATAADWLKQNQLQFRGVALVDSGSAPAAVAADNDELGSLTILALPWLKGDELDSLSPEHKAEIRRHLELAVAKCDKLIRVVSGSESESTPDP